MWFICAHGFAGNFGAFTVEGYAGDSIIIKCKYDEKVMEESKYFSRIYYGFKGMSHSKTLIKTHHQGWWNEGRFSVYDNKEERFLKIIMRHLSKSDEGKYSFVVDTKLAVYKDVYLKVNEGENSFICMCVCMPVLVC